MTNNQKVVTPRAAITASKLNPTEIAAKARIGITTVYRVISKNRWPANPNTSDALKRALGIEVANG